MRATIHGLSVSKTCCALLMLLALAPAARAEGEVRVTVIAVLASSKHKDVDPVLKCLADKMRELDPNLTGFKAGRMTTKVLSRGGEATFPLVDEENAIVILEPRPKDGKGICVTVKTPGVGGVTYTIKCEKCFPIATPYRTKNGHRLIVGFLVEPVVRKESPKKP